MAVAILLLFPFPGCNVQPPPAPAPVKLPQSALTQPRWIDEIAGGRFIDLTHQLDETTLYWPTEIDDLRLQKAKAGKSPGGYFYAAYRFAAPEHGGTHIDAPLHFAEKGETVDQVPLTRLIGQAAVVDVSAKCADNPDYQIGIDDLRNWETRRSRQLFDVILLLRTDWAARWPDRERYLGTAKRGPEAVRELHFPGLHPDAARWLAEHRSVKCVGIDTASIDFGESTDFQSHRLLFAHNIPALENVGLMKDLPSEGALLVALPLKITGGSGSPVRIVAMLPKEK